MTPPTVAAGSSIARRGLRQPNRMTHLYAQMKQSCPEHMKAYAECVIAEHNSGNLQRNSCDAQFALVKECFRSVRRESP
eukprot:CAMPEP_0195303310 /NCGR_PEP_ID=MMETSP0707-20130614/32583_1 /TAXON_ID=33640 /ORGANISM="Asterionellopsis glacialis, Strain CCMP134" /LENGTH=78 /DNA_ID=CAMNT_0040366815 /DNA_START=46 /DNA_END=282 /DNA_ORIENTATION=+